MVTALTAQRRSTTESASPARPQPVVRPPAREALVLGGGRELPPSTRERLEASFAAPLEHAPVDTDAEVTELADEPAATPEILDTLSPSRRRRAEPEVAPLTTRDRIVQRAEALATETAAPIAPAAEVPVTALAAKAPEPPAPVDLGQELEAEESAGLAVAADVAKQQVAARATHSRPHEEAPVAPAVPDATEQDLTSPALEVGPLESTPENDAPVRTVEPVARGPPISLARALIVQTKLSVSRPGDSLEREADAVSARVVRGGTVSPPSPCGAPPGRLQRALPHARGPPPAASSRLPRTVAAVVGTPGGGSPLNTAVRARVEPHVGVDLGHVRIRQDADAAAAARDLHARAFTSGSTIFLAAESSPDDLALMAHEATHVAQQETSRGCAHDADARRHGLPPGRLGRRSRCRTGSSTRSATWSARSPATRC